MTIKVKTLFNGWREVDRSQAENFILHLYGGITMLSGDEKLEYINSRIKGLNAESVLYSKDEPKEDNGKG